MKTQSINTYWVLTFHWARFCFKSRCYTCFLEHERVLTQRRGRKMCFTYICYYWCWPSPIHQDPEVIESNPLLHLFFLLSSLLFSFCKGVTDMKFQHPVIYYRSEEWWASTCSVAKMQYNNIGRPSRLIPDPTPRLVYVRSQLSRFSQALSTARQQTLHPTKKGNVATLPERRLPDKGA